MRLLSRLSAAGGALITSLVAPAATAQPGSPVAGSESVHVDLSWVRGPGAESCATEAEIAARVTARLGRNPFSVGADRTIEAVVRGDRDEKTAALFLRAKDGSLLGERSFESTDPDCTALEQASVLAIALLIDPEAALAPEGSGEPSAPLPAAPAPAVVPPPVWIPIFIPVPALAASAPLPPARAPVRLAAMVGIEGSVGPLPRPAVGLVLGVDVEPVHRIHAVVAMRYSPEVESDDGDFSFSFVRGEVGGCLDAWAARRWALAGCSALSVGALAATSLRLAPVDPGEELWADVGAGMRAIAEPWPAAILALEVGGRAALVRPQFRIAGAGTAFEPAAGLGFATLSAGVRFP